MSRGYKSPSFPPVSTDYPFDLRAALAAAEAQAGRDPRASLAALDVLFRAGRLPEPPLKSFYAGHFAVFALPRGLANLARWASSVYEPWRGKTFELADACGANIVRRRFLPLGRLVWPFYRRYVAVGDGAYRVFRFRTYPGSALLDPDVQVLKIDYDLPENPRLVVRRVLDEIVQLEDGLYLGRWHFRWPGGRPQLIAYFVLGRLHSAFS